MPLNSYFSQSCSTAMALSKRLLGIISNNLESEHPFPPFRKRSQIQNYQLWAYRERCKELVWSLKGHSQILHHADKITDRSSTLFSFCWCKSKLFHLLCKPSITWFYFIFPGPSGTLPPCQIESLLFFPLEYFSLRKPCLSKPYSSCKACLNQPMAH